MSATKAATRRPSSRCESSARPVSTSAGVWMSRPAPSKKRARTVSVVGLGRLVAAKATPRTKSFFGFSNSSVAPTVSAVSLPRLSLAPSSSAMSKNGATRSRRRRAPRLRSVKQAHVAGKIRRDEHVVVHRQIAAPLGEMGDARLVGHRMVGVLALERREARRVASRRRRGRAHRRSAPGSVVVALSKRNGVRPLWRGVAHRRIDFAVVGDDDRGAAAGWPSPATTGAACDG